jgi:hypothetical protein
MSIASPPPPERHAFAPYLSSRAFFPATLACRAQLGWPAVGRKKATPRQRASRLVLPSLPSIPAEAT